MLRPGSQLLAEGAECRLELVKPGAVREVEQPVLALLQEPRLERAAAAAGIPS
jgi:hypothetical protein